jgi:hypothetical protein
MRAAVLAALVGALLVPASASAAAYDCPTRAHVTKGVANELSGTGETATHTVRHGPLYAVEQPLTLRYGGFRFHVGGGSIIGLNCSGAAGTSAVSDPMLDLQMGRASVATGGRSHMGTIGTNEMLLDPYADRRMTIAAERVPKGAPSLAEVLATGPSALDLGRSSAHRTAGSGYINITPHIGYVRRTNGLCHQARGARIESRGYRANDGVLWTRGRVHYLGLAPFSPR